jgi:D-alanyl-D-alanine carboxypeptidase
MSQPRIESLAKIDAKSEDKIDPVPLTNGVIQTQPIATIPGSSEPMKPVKVKTVQVKAGPVKLASAGPDQPAPPITNTIPLRTDAAASSSAVSKSEAARSEPERADLPPQPPGHGTGNGILGVLSASAVTSSSSQTMAYADASQAQPALAPLVSSSVKPEISHSGWIIQVGALESESEARQRIEAARSQAHGLLNKADPFTEPVVAKGDRKLFRARFAGLDREQAEAACRTLKRNDISCITVRN